MGRGKRDDSRSVIGVAGVQSMMGRGPNDVAIVCFIVFARFGSNRSVRVFGADLFLLDGSVMGTEALGGHAPPGVRFARQDPTISWTEPSIRQ